MSLQRDIIVVNQFSVMRPSGGTRGETPGKFVLRYMARDNATELITPVTKYNDEATISRYNQRRQLVDDADSLDFFNKGFRRLQGLGGRSFGKNGREDLGSVSLSDQGIHDLSKTIQNEFDNGHTVFESVISFDGHYLKKHGLVPQNILVDKAGHAFVKGAYKGKLDQMKLRLSIMNGLNQMADRKLANNLPRFDSLAYVGVIQVDTKQVHCHLAMVDKGQGRQIMINGRLEQRGMLTKADRENLRQNIDKSINDYEPVHRLSTQITREEQDVKSFTKDYSQKTLNQALLCQLLLTSLPKDKQIWRSNSKDKRMQKANNFIRRYFMQLRRQRQSSYARALKMIAKNKKLKEKDVKSLQDRLTNSCINAVYDRLKQVPDNVKDLNTPIIDAAINDVQMPVQNPAEVFMYHLKHYRQRLGVHRQKADDYNAAKIDYLKRQAQGETTPESKVMLDFFEKEEEYHRKLMTKYQLLLPLNSRDQSWKKDYKDFQQKQNEYENWDKALRDNHLINKKAQEAHNYVLQTYNDSHGQLISIGGNAPQERKMTLRNRFLDSRNKLVMSLAKDNKKLIRDKNGNYRVENRSSYKFGDVKGLDLHEIENDFNEKPDVPKKVEDQFIQMANERMERYKRVVNYAQNTNQPQILMLIDQDDIVNMYQYAQSLNPSQKSKELEQRQKRDEAQKRIENQEKRRHHYTVRINEELDNDLRHDIDETVKKEMSSYQM